MLVLHPIRAVLLLLLPCRLAAQKALPSGERVVGGLPLVGAGGAGLTQHYVRTNARALSQRMLTHAIQHPPVAAAAPRMVELLPHQGGPALPKPKVRRLGMLALSQHVLQSGRFVSCHALWPVRVQSRA